MFGPNRKDKDKVQKELEEKQGKAFLERYKTFCLDEGWELVPVIIKYDNVHQHLSRAEFRVRKITEEDKEKLTLKINS